jgi:hypothetical protein
VSLACMFSMTLVTDFATGLVFYAVPPLVGAIDPRWVMERCFLYLDVIVLESLIQ